MSGRSESVEMYLKSLAELGGVSSSIPIGRIAERLGVSPVSANEMMKRLGEQKLIRHKPYTGVKLTEKGRKLANSVIRRQRLWEIFLVDYLQLNWASAYDMACDLEHATSPEVTESLAAYLGQPTRCPHGNPIPDTGGQVCRSSELSLADLEVGQTARIQAIAPESSEVLRYLADKKLLPGNLATVYEAEPLQGPLTLLVAREDASDEVILGLNLASLVLVDLK
jgi:DtxR family Mn-dependent transcriptional regulator